MIAPFASAAAGGAISIRTSGLVAGKQSANCSKILRTNESALYSKKILPICSVLLIVQGKITYETAVSFARAQTVFL